MDDLSEKLAELLNDPESLNRVRQMAENLLGNADSGADAQPAPREETTELLGGDELKSIMSVISHLKSSENDSRVQLITALKPHLSEARQQRADSAIKLLRLLELWPYIKESGLFKL